MELPCPSGFKLIFVPSQPVPTAVSRKYCTFFYAMSQRLKMSSLVAPVGSNQVKAVQDAGDENCLFPTGSFSFVEHLGSTNLAGYAVSWIIGIYCDCRFVGILVASRKALYTPKMNNRWYFKSWLEHLVYGELLHWLIQFGEGWYHYASSLGVFCTLQLEIQFSMPEFEKTPSDISPSLSFQVKTYNVKNVSSRMTSVACIFLVFVIY